MNKNTLISMAVTIMAAFSLGTLMNVATPSSTAAQCQGVDCVSQEIITNTKYNTGKSKSVGSIASVITNTLLFFAGAFAVIMIIYGGILYALSSGDATKTKKAKDTILYAVIGLAVALLSYAIVTYVVTKL